MSAALPMEAELDAAAQEVCRQRTLNLERVLGSGAFKRAYLARGQTGAIALKVAPVIGGVDRLLREVDALRGCAHPNIATLVDAFGLTHGGKDYWIVLETFVPGGTLESKLAAGPIDAQQVKAIGVALASALEHLHDRRLVHRDIKPANILFDSDGVTPVLTDFGVVRMLDMPSLTRDFLGFGPGTPAYAAPEQLNNEKALIDWRTDQFDLALVLSECLLGRHPFIATGQNIHTAIVEVASKRNLPDENRQALEARGFGCLVRALAPWPVSRYRRPADFVSALGE